MPNEKIRHTEHGSTVELDGPDAPYDRTTTATVHWYQGQQVVLEIDASGDMLKYVSATGEVLMDGAMFDSLAIPLDRAEINRLIKALRRARDAAYGRDE